MIQIGDTFSGWAGLRRQGSTNKVTGKYFACKSDCSAEVTASRVTMGLFCLQQM